jgi:hypothetical protein
MKEVMEDNQSFVVNMNAREIWYSLKDVERNAKTNLDELAKYFQNTGRRVTKEEYDRISGIISKTIQQFITEVEGIEAKIDHCFDEVKK